LQGKETYYFKIQIFAKHKLKLLGYFVEIIRFAD
jgi:hypothetical protein